MRVLVTAASKHGATNEIAERIGAVLAAHDLEVEVKKPHEVSELGGYEAVVVGSGIYLGRWLKEARCFVDAHAAELAQRPTWLFASGSIMGDPPVGDDPNAMGAGLVEWLVQTTQARELKLFAGKLDLRRLGLARRLQADPTTRFPTTVWIRLAATQPLYFPPGTGYHYSNVGFEVLGLVIERVTGQPLQQVYRQRILQPLSLAHTAYDPQGDISGPHARGYLVNPDGSLVDQTAVHWGIGAEGGIVSDAADTGRFLVALMQDRLLGPVAAAGM
jgi:menaquinone-dependent protoporphyrinogen oxidase